MSAADRPPKGGYRPLRFIGEPIEVEFDQPPMLEKDPGCPARFSWADQSFEIKSKLSEWRENARRGRMQRNMQPQHAERAATRGSWGVGRSYFRVRVEGGRIFELYYDRAPQGIDRRKGSWHLYRELVER